jgi:hypothetical protein
MIHWMQRTVSTSFMALLIGGPLLLAGCGSDKSEEPAATNAGDAAAAAKEYPLATCVVSGDELGSMGDPVVLVHEGQTMKFCCEGCIDKFNADPDKYLAMLAEGSDEQGGHDDDNHEGHDH